MSANGYLTRLADSAVLRELEKQNVDRSLVGLRARLDAHFKGTLLTGNLLKRQLTFGSYTRGTILPRSMDEQSDVDHMVVFSDSDAKPQAYLDRLRRFAEERYARSEIYQSNPTIVLELNHIRFELVPAIESWGGLRIPAKSGSFSSWIDTRPNDFNERLTAKNKDNGNLIKPLVRVLKYWNARNNYPFESYALEQMIVDHTPLAVILFGGNLWDRFSSFINDLNANWGDPDYKKQAIARAKELVAEVKTLEARGDDINVQRKLERWLPLRTS